MFVLPHESDGFVVVEVLFVKPRLGADAGVGEVLVGVRGEESKESHLHYSCRLVCDLRLEGTNRKKH